MKKHEEILEKDSEIELNSSSTSVVSELSGISGYGINKPHSSSKRKDDVSSTSKTHSSQKRKENIHPAAVTDEIRGCLSSVSSNIEQITPRCSKSSRKSLVRNIINDVIDLTTNRPTTSHQPPTPHQPEVEHVEVNSEPEIGNSNREYQVYRSVAGGVINSTNTMHEEHFARLNASLKSLRVPPSYSQVLKMRPPQGMSYASSQIDSFPTVPMIVRQPPPSYSEVHGIESEELSIISDESFIFGPDPVYLICPRCRTMVCTEVHTERSSLSYITSALLCVCLCWPCFWIPYCLKSCSCTYHTCPICSHYFGMYQPW